MMVKPKSSFLIMVFIIVVVIAMLSSPVGAKFQAPNPIQFVKRLWAKFRRGKQQQDIPKWMKSDGNCSSNPSLPSAPLDAHEIAKLASEKDALLKHIETLKSKTATARRDLSRLLVEKNRASQRSPTVGNATDGAVPSSACSADAPRVPSYEALTFISVGLLMMTAAAVAKAREENAKVDKLTKKLEVSAPVTVVEKEVVSYRNRIKELENQGQREREVAEATTRELDTLKANIGAWEGQLQNSYASTESAEKERNEMLAMKKSMEERVSNLQQQLQQQLQQIEQQQQLQEQLQQQHSSSNASRGTGGLVVIDEVTSTAKTSSAKAHAPTQAHALASGSAPKAADLAELHAVRARVVDLEAQVKTLPQLREEKDVALREFKRTSDLLDALDMSQSQQCEQLASLRNERDQLVAAKGVLTLSLDNSKREFAGCLARIADLEEQAADSRRFILVEQERDELLAGKARTDQCFLDMEQQLTLEKRRVADHQATIRDLEQRLVELERRKGVKFASSPTYSPTTHWAISETERSRPGPSGAASGVSQSRLGPDEQPSVDGVGGAVGLRCVVDVGASGDLTQRIDELVNQADRDQRQIKQLQEERESLLSYKEACESQGSGAGTSDKSNAHVTAIIKQRDLLVASKTILEDHIAELKQEVKWCDHDRDQLQKKERLLDAQVVELDRQVTTQQGQLAVLQGTADTLTERNTVLESAHATADSQLALLRKNIADLVAAKEVKERELERDRQYLKETCDRSAVLEAAVGELAQRVTSMQQQRDVLKLKAAHARFGSGGVVGGSAMGSGSGSGSGSSSGSEDDDDAWQDVFQRNVDGLEDPDTTVAGAMSGSKHDEGTEEDLQSLQAFLRRAQEAVKRQQVANNEEFEVRMGLPLGADGGTDGVGGGAMKRNDASQNSMGGMFAGGDVLTALSSLLVPATSGTAITPTRGGAAAAAAAAANNGVASPHSSAGRLANSTATTAPARAGTIVSTSASMSASTNITRNSDDDQDSLLGLRIPGK